ncbi:MAG: DUF2332 family protein [Desulfobulbus sp.]
MCSHQEIDRESRRARLARRFRKQQTFSLKTSPLAACLCGIIADRLDAVSDENGLSAWLLGASCDCASFTVPMLLLAAMHREILRFNPDFASLAAYFPTVGGHRTVVVKDIEDELVRLMLAHRDELAGFVKSATVQTNETARGLCWLLPVLYLPWPEMILVDLGCSAGLNLVADWRHYCLHGTQEDGRDFAVGTGESPQFSVITQGPFVPPDQKILPKIHARIGCDLHPIILNNAEDELALSSFIWGDQLQRMSRLQEGIRAFHRVQKSAAPVQLFPVDLPVDLLWFLERSLPLSSRIPIVIYNTYLTPYLSDKGESLGTYLHRWATGQPQPVLWLQWELPHRGRGAPEFGWLEWTAELWSQEGHHKWQLAWVDPHGAKVRWLPGLVDWAQFFGFSQYI